MGMADDIIGTSDIRSTELSRLTRGGIVLSSFADLDDLDDVFSEWDENAPIAQLARGSQPHALPASARTTTLSDPVTTAVLAQATRRAHAARPSPAAASLEEALLALTNGVPELLPSDC